MPPTGSISSEVSTATWVTGLPPSSSMAIMTVRSELGGNMFPLNSMVSLYKTPTWISLSGVTNISSTKLS